LELVIQLPLDTNRTSIQQTGRSWCLGRDKLLPALWNQIIRYLKQGTLFRNRWGLRTNVPNKILVSSKL